MGCCDLCVRENVRGISMQVGASKKLVQAMENKRPLAPLSVGDSVQVQNREDNHPLRWDNTGQIMESLEHGQYLV